ncbi:hypothetical protein ABZW49_42815 [Nonomuraea wenchangensis]
MPRNSSAARREQSRALAAAGGISYTQALRRLAQARTAIGEADGEEAALVVQKSKKDIRARQAATGEAYNAARRALDHDPGQDRAAIALALSKAWQYAEVPCPRVVVYPVGAGAHRMVLLTRLLFARLPAGDGLTAEELDGGSPYTESTHHRAGKVMDLWQTGRKDWPVDTTRWTTSLDIDLMGFVPDEAVTLLEVLEEIPPLLADQVEPMHARLTRRWAHARALLAGAADDDTMTRADRVLVHDHRQEVTRAVQNEVTRAKRAEDCPEPEPLGRCPAGRLPLEDRLARLRSAPVVLPVGGIRLLPEEM